MDVLLAVDSGNAVGWDGETGAGSVGWFEAVCAGGDGSRDAGVVLNWCVISSLSRNRIRRLSYLTELLR